MQFNTVHVNTFHVISWTWIKVPALDSLAKPEQHSAGIPAEQQGIGQNLDEKLQACIESRTQLSADFRLSDRGDRRTAEERMLQFQARCEATIRREAEAAELARTRMLEREQIAKLPAKRETSGGGVGTDGAACLLGVVVDLSSSVYSSLWESLSVHVFLVEEQEEFLVVLPDVPIIGGLELSLGRDSEHLRMTLLHEAVPLAVELRDSDKR
eukprot:s575_g41.t1